MILFVDRAALKHKGTLWKLFSSSFVSSLWCFYPFHLWGIPLGGHIEGLMVPVGMKSTRLGRRLDRESHLQRVPQSPMVTSNLKWKKQRDPSWPNWSNWMKKVSLGDGTKNPALALAAPRDPGSRWEKVLKLLFSKIHLKTHRKDSQTVEKQDGTDTFAPYIKDQFGGNQWPPQLPSRPLQWSTVEL